MTAEEQIGTNAEDAAVPASSAPTTVILSPCRCPKGPHAEDEVYLAKRLPLAVGIAGAWVVDNATSVPTVVGQLAEVYLGGITGWTFVDVRGKPEPVTPESVARLLPYEDGGLEVAQAASALYEDALMRPFRKRYPERFLAGASDSSTSANSDFGSPSPTPSEPSSPSSSEAGKPSEDPAP